MTAAWQAFEEKSHSLLGLFLNAPLHCTKKAPISQGEIPLWKPQNYLTIRFKNNVIYRFTFRKSKRK